jgi:serine/threonine protein kinase
LHRDININNLVYCQKGSDKISGVLIDYDLATLIGRTPEGEPIPIIGERIGTKPFMALDFQKSKRAGAHTFRHDLESYFYCLLWMIMPDRIHRLPEDGTILLHSLSKWEVHNAKEVERSKIMLIAVNGIPPDTIPQFKYLRAAATYLMMAQRHRDLDSFPMEEEEILPELPVFKSIRPKLSFTDFEPPLVQPNQGFMVTSKGLQNAPLTCALSMRLRLGW